MATSEWMSLMNLATELGMLDDDLLAVLTSRQWTRYAARGLVQAAQAKVRDLKAALK